MTNQTVDAVKVLATDFNGETWDGIPFSAFPDWLSSAILCRCVGPVAVDLDYVEFDVLTSDGVVRATAGDWIEYHEGGVFSVRKTD
jgi:hypothetical protein